MFDDIIKKLTTLDVSEYTEEKNGLTYLSWAHAWGEVLKIVPSATYTIKKFGDAQLPYVYDGKTGYMVFTDMTIEGVTHEMWLPVMDGANKAMMEYAYEYKTKYATKTVDKADMFDINKTIMRCLVKNIAMFGLGLYIYKGEDLPDTGEETPEGEEPKQTAQPKAKKVAKKVETPVAVEIEPTDSLITPVSKGLIIKTLTESGLNVVQTMPLIAGKLGVALSDLKESHKEQILEIIKELIKGGTK